MTEKGSLIEMTSDSDVGNFIKNRTVVNLDGLINGVKYFDHLHSSTANQYLDSIGLGYIYNDTYVVVQSAPCQLMFEGLLLSYAVIGDMTLLSLHTVSSRR